MDDDKKPVEAIEEDSDAVQREHARVEKLRLFGATLAATRDKWIKARTASGWDKRVAQDIDAYHMRDAANRGASSMMETVEQGYPVVSRETKPTRSTLYIGVTRQRTNAAEARFTDIVLPTDDRNWGIKPSPDAEGALAKEEGGYLVDPATRQPVLIDETGAVTTDPERGRPLEKREVAEAAERVARRAADAMTQLIDDQFVECDFLGECRKMIHDSAVMGTGVLRGPIVFKSTKRAWIQGPTGDWAKQVKESLRPVSHRVDPRNVWEDPACGDDVQNGQGIFELDRKTEKRVRQLLKQPVYMKEQLAQVLDEGPKRNPALQEFGHSREAETLEQEKLFYHWYYWGEIKREDLEVATPEAEDGELGETVTACVEMINDTVVRAYISPLDDGELPYDFFPWEKVQDSPRGYGQPYLMRAEQSATNAAWRQMMDNSGVTAGPQIMANKRLIQPADGQWVLRPFKFWNLLDDSVDPAQAFRSVEFNSHQGELAGVIELAQRLGDQSSGEPMLTQGDPHTAPETVGATQMLMNSANVVQRRRVKQYDDYVTKRHVRRYYEYNMMYSTDNKVKGDFQVDARGSSALITRDLANQALLQMLQVAGSPTFGPMVNHKKLFEKTLQAQHIDPKDIMLDDGQIEQNKQAAAQQVDPRIETAKINAEARMKQAEAVASNRAVETEVMREAEVENRRLRLMQLQQQRDIEILKLAQAEKVSVEQIKAQLAQTALNERTKKELAASEMMFKMRAPDGKGI